MKITFFAIGLFSCLQAFCQDKVQHNYCSYLDLHQDNYTQLIKTADSLLAEYSVQPFEFLREDGSCCLDGAVATREFYSRALKERPGDEDAKKGITNVDNMREDLEILKEETNYGKVLERGEVYYNDGRYKKALTFYKRALELSPTSKTIKKRIKETEKKIEKYGSS